MSDRKSASEWFGPFGIKAGLPYKEDTPVYMEVGGDRPAVVDLRYAGLLSTLRWQYDGHYVITTSYYSMHRLVMGGPKGKDIHHKNEDPLNNRVSNLVVVEKSVHTLYHNTKKRKGAHKMRRGDYMARSSESEDGMTIGYYETEEEAALAYDWAARILEGPEAEVNFPDLIVSASAAFMIRTSGGEYFDVGFRKRGTGKFRFMTCRLARPPGPYFMANRNLIVVKTKGLLGYRAIPVEGIETLYINDRKYKVVK